GRSSHAASIWSRLHQHAPSGFRPIEIPLAELESFAPSVLADDERAGSGSSAEDVDPAVHAAAEAGWGARRRGLVGALGPDRLATPSGLAHEPEPPDVSAFAADERMPPSPRLPRAGTALGVAVHSVLQWLDLESLANLAALARNAADQHAVDAAE